MTLDIQNGDLLVVGSNEYAIRFVSAYTRWGGSPTFARMASVTASTKRTPAIVDGKRGDPVTKLATLKVTPLDPVSAELAQRVEIKTPFALLECFAADSDGFVRLALEDLKR